ncbi:transcription factor E2F3 isoform 2-T2 [Anableps anableps]
MFSTLTEERENFYRPEAKSRLELQGGVPREPRDGGGTMESVAGTNQTKTDVAFQTHKTKKWSHTWVPPTPEPTVGRLLFEKSRTDNSLVFLTRKFAQRLNHSLDGVLDLNLVSSELNVSKRRLYDITNVLEGINLMKKTYKNHIQWLGGPLDDEVAGGLKALIEEEEKLDELIQSSAQQISKLCEENLHQRYAYLTYEDIRSIPGLEEQTVIVIKAPSESQLQVPHPEEVYRSGEACRSTSAASMAPLMFSSALIPRFLWNPLRHQLQAVPGMDSSSSTPVGKTSLLLYLHSSQGRCRLKRMLTVAVKRKVSQTQSVR